MNVIRLFPVIFSFILLGAHFSRQDFPTLSILCFLIPLLLFIKRTWVIKLTQIFLVLGSIEWIRSIFYYINQRQELGESYIRLVIIIGIIALFTGLSALVFKNQSLKERYNLQ